MKNSKKSPPDPPAMNPYVFTVLLILFGLWCFYDGWLTNDPEMLEHTLFNRVLSIVLLSWGIYDFYKVRKNRAKPNREEGRERENSGGEKEEHDSQI
ncbi:MAG: hypothetical protein ACQETC_13410 [Thermodesulfobacteriota bacterium]